MYDVDMRVREREALSADGEDDEKKKRSCE